MSDHGYDKLKVPELKAECRARIIKGYSALRKSKLIELLLEYDSRQVERLNQAKDDKAKDDEELE
jgi:hypothetical protein